MKKERKKAAAEVFIDNETVRITKYSFNVNEETGFHTHKWDYVVVPQTDGKLLMVDEKGVETSSKLITGSPYFRKAGVSHNVINCGKENLVFIEIEIKS